MKKRHADEQTIAIVREAGAVPITTLCKRHNISKQTFFRWRNKLSGMDVPEARRLKDLESENARLSPIITKRL